MENTEIQYRFVKLADSEQLAQLYLTIFGKKVNKRYFEIKYELTSDKNQLSTVALIGEKIIGCFGVLEQTFVHSDSGKQYELAQGCDFFMLPEFQGKGVFKRLYEHSRLACEESGKDMYAFHSTQTDKVCRKWGWVDQARMSRFHIKAYPFSTSRLLRILGLNTWRTNKVEKLMGKYSSDAEVRKLNSVSGKYTHDYSAAFFEAKRFTNRYWIEIDGCTLLVKYDYILTIGFVHFGKYADIPNLLKRLKSIARKAMIHEVVFQVHSSSLEANELKRWLEEKPSFPISSISFDSSGPEFSEVKLNLLDMDIF